MMQFTWRSISSVWADLRSSLFWRVGDGRRVRFWTDHWVKELGPLSNYCTNARPVFQDATVYVMVTLEGEWNWEYLKGIYQGKFSCILQPFLRFMGSRVETPLHAVRDCLVARNVWAIVQGVCWNILFGIITWRIWKRRNNLLFNGEFCKASIELNTDESRHLITGQASAGGLFRDHQGKWVTDYSRNMGVCSVLNVELWAIIDGLDIA
ncbi:hypothetical protein Golax_009309 [Gossypium laxum]|uniref:RNase H type-1 domain-containing protein n=1 Tax=Gossypium laxum TaxID=34288 RepID=A0A7J9ACR9_9ROSI|nr:hypothetical protein [Gossypium laxum]